MSLTPAINSNPGCNTKRPDRQTKHAKLTIVTKQPSGFAQCGPLVRQLMANRNANSERVYVVLGLSAEHAPLMFPIVDAIKAELLLKGRADGCTDLLHVDPCNKVEVKSVPAYYAETTIKFNMVSALPRCGAPNHQPISPSTRRDFRS